MAIKLDITKLPAEKTDRYVASSRPKREINPGDTVAQHFPSIDGKGSAIRQGGKYKPRDK